MGYYERDRALAEANAVVFHDRFAARQFGAIYDDFDPAMQQAAPRVEALRAMAWQAQHWGERVSSVVRTTSCKPSQVQLVYETTFSKGKATEWFVWRVSSQKARLLRYQLFPGVVDPLQGEGNNCATG